MVQNFCFKYNMADLFAIFSRKASKICFRAPEATFWFQVLTRGQLLLLRRMPIVLCSVRLPSTPSIVVYPLPCKWQDFNCGILSFHGREEKLKFHSSLKYLFSNTHVWVIVYYQKYILNHEKKFSTIIKIHFCKLLRMPSSTSIQV